MCFYLLINIFILWKTKDTNGREKRGRAVLGAMTMGIHETLILLCMVHRIWGGKRKKKEKE